MAADRLVLVLNCGSSSIKYQLLAPDTAEVLAGGLVERVGEPNGQCTHNDGQTEHRTERPITDHANGLELVHEQFTEHGPSFADHPLTAVGHRIVHGGETFRDPVIIDDAVINAVRELSSLAPLHNPPALAGIEAARALHDDVPHIAVFDTAFFSNLPAAAATYAIDAEVAARHGIRKYGFHGTSHQYVAGRVAEAMDSAGESAGETAGDTTVDPGLRQVVLHLGNGASMSAIRDGRAVDTSMGLTPLQGLVMGTRPGDVDPGLHAFLGREAGMDLNAIDQLLNKRSGLKGMAGENDFRELVRLRSTGDEAAALAFDVYVHRLRFYLGGYVAVLGGVDAISFTAGVGENSAELRAAVLTGLDELGIVFDPDRNESAERGLRFIEGPASRTRILVVPTNEELAIARAALALA